VTDFADDLSGSLAEFPEGTDLHSGAVAVAYVHSAEVAHSWHMALMELVGYDLQAEGRFVRGGWLAMSYSTGGIVEARNAAVKKFLDERESEWMLWLDTDMGFPPDVIDALIAVADPVKRPVVGALCFVQRQREVDGKGGYHCAPACTIFDLTDEGIIGRADYPINSIVQCAATGSACILIHRSVFEKIRKELGGDVWYDRLPNVHGEGLMGEDISFCVRAGAVGCPVFVHTGVKTSHLKHLWLQEKDFWEWRQAPPATEQVAVIVPTMKRPQNAKRFMDTLRASTGLANVYPVIQDDDELTRKAWQLQGIEPLVSEGPSFSEKVNIAFRATTEPWIFIVGDDVHFHPAWFDHALHLAKQSGCKVIGTQDLGSPRVMAGEHATHLLIARDYVDEQGASWDGPGIVCHEGYRHWFVDDEIVWAAKQRQVWAFAAGSVVEHMHPLWKKGEPDETYKIGQSFSQADHDTFLDRAEKFTGHRPVPR
jgi:hypothetical protein